MNITDFEIFRVVLHIPKFEDDAASLVGDAHPLYKIQRLQNLGYVTLL